jgi:DNA-binding LytR/AlgR family response regulator
MEKKTLEHLKKVFELENGKNAELIALETFAQGTSDMYKDKDFLDGKWGGKVQYVKREDIISAYATDRYMDIRRAIKDMSILDFLRLKLSKLKSKEDGK